MVSGVYHPRRLGGCAGLCLPQSKKHPRFRLAASSGSPLLRIDRCMAQYRSQGRLNMHLGGRFGVTRTWGRGGVTSFHPDNVQCRLCSPPHPQLFPGFTMVSRIRLYLIWRTVVRRRDPQIKKRLSPNPSATGVDLPESNFSSGLWERHPRRGNYVKLSVKLSFYRPLSSSLSRLI